MSNEDRSRHLTRPNRNQGLQYEMETMRSMNMMHSQQNTTQESSMEGAQHARSTVQGIYQGLYQGLQLNQNNGQYSDLFENHTYEEV